MENEVDKFFKFKIGDRVRHIARTSEFMEGKVEDIFIVQRMLEQCPGGIQLHYTCRALGDEGMATNLIRFNEVELVGISRPC